jgi:hypothetical protein
VAIFPRFGLLARLHHGIDFEAIDERPVDIVFLLLLPKALMTRSSMRWPVLPVHFETQKPLSVSGLPPIATPCIERWLILVAFRPN